MANVNIVDLIIVFILLCGAWQGYRKGLIHNLIRLLAVVVSIACGMFYSGAIAAFLEKQFGLQSILSAKAAAAVAQTVSLPAAANGLQAGSPGDILQQLRQLQLPPAALQFLEEQLYALTQTTLGSAIDNVATFLGTVLANMLVNALIFCIILVVVNIGAAILHWVLKDVLGIAKSGIDSLAGMCLGLVKSALIIALVLAVLSPILAWQTESTYSVLLQQSYLANQLLDLIYKVVGESIDLWQMWGMG